MVHARGFSKWREAMNVSLILLLLFSLAARCSSTKLRGGADCPPGRRKIYNELVSLIEDSASTAEAAKALHGHGVSILCLHAYKSMRICRLSKF